MGFVTFENLHKVPKWDPIFSRGYCKFAFCNSSSQVIDRLGDLRVVRVFTKIMGSIHRKFSRNGDDLILI